MSDVLHPDTLSASSETASGSPGAILRRCREFHGITLEEASETTKIGLSHLKALEDDQIREFANQAYLKGFLRIYATFLGLDAEDIARMYGKLFGGPSENTAPNRISTSSSGSPRRFIPLKKLVFPALLLAVIIITATFFKRAPAPLERLPYPVAVDSTGQGAALQMAASSVKIQKPVVDVPPKKADTHAADVSHPENTALSKRPLDTPKGLILKIKVTQNGTLTAVVDDSAPQQYTLTIGDIFEWKAEKKVALDVSNAGGIDVELNGKPVKSLGSPGRPAYVEFDVDGSK